MKWENELTTLSIPYKMLCSNQELEGHNQTLNEQQTRNVE
jgi:hypothetical protein